MKFKNQLKTVCGAAALLALLASGSASALWSSTLRIASVATLTGAQTYIEFTTTPPMNKPACATTGYYQLVGTAAHIEAATKVASAALLAGRPVKVYFDAVNCLNGDGKITDIRMY